MRPELKNVYQGIDEFLSKEWQFTPPAEFTGAIGSLTAKIEQLGFERHQLFIASPIPIRDEIFEAMLRLNIDPNEATDIAYDLIEKFSIERSNLVRPIIENAELWNNSVLGVVFDGERADTNYNIARDYSFVAGRLVTTLPIGEEASSAKIGRKLNDSWRSFPVFTGGLPPLGLARQYGTGNEQTIVVPVNRIFAVYQFTPNP